MTRDELEEFYVPHPTQEPFCVRDLANKADRTLLYGYMSNRNSFHVYLRDMKITRLIYDDQSSTTLIKGVGAVWGNGSLLIPDKRIYPQCSDLEFCRLMRLRGYALPFTTYKEREPQQFYGRVLTLQEEMDAMI